MDSRSSLCSESITFDSTTELGTYRLAVHLYSGKDDTPFGDRVVDVAVNIYDHNQLMTCVHPEPSIVRDALVWYVGDVIKSAAGFNFEKKTMLLGYEVCDLVCHLVILWILFVGLSMSTLKILRKCSSCL